VGRFPALRRRFRLFELAGGGVLVVIGLLLVTGLWDGLLNQLRVWAGPSTCRCTGSLPPRPRKSA